MPDAAMSVARDTKSVADALDWTRRELAVARPFHAGGTRRGFIGLELARKAKLLGEPFPKVLVVIDKKNAPLGRHP